MKQERFIWAGHVIRMVSSRGPRLATEDKPEAEGPRTPTELGWADQEVGDLSIMDVKKCRVKAQGKGGMAKGIGGGLGPVKERRATKEEENFKLM